MKKSKRVLLLILVLVMAMAMCLTMSSCGLLDTGDSESTTTTSEEDEGDDTSSSIPTVIMLVVLVGVFYFFLIRPEKKRKKQVAEMRSGLSVGDTVTTIGGVVGKIVEMDDDLVTIETSEDQVRMQFAKWGISNSGVKKDESTK